MAEMRTFQQAYRDIVGRVAESDAEARRLRAAHRVAEVSRVLAAAGWVEKRWTAGTPGSPCTRRVVVGGTSYRYKDWDVELTGGWLDHPYRLVNATTKQTRFIAEPYGLDTEDIVRLGKIAERGWEVTISATLALHFPGETVAVILTRRGDEPDDA